MDTATHFAMGIGLYGLAHLDSTIASQPETAQAVLVGTILGSQAPDFDGLTRLRGNASYVRNHRGPTHSLPMIMIWPILLTAGIHPFYPNASLLHLLFWTGIAVGLHIFIDLFNSYGTQALRPFSKRWVSWDILNIIDPIILGLHGIGFILWWLTPLSPGHLFAVIYLLLTGYIIWRTWVHHKLLCWVKEKVGVDGTYSVIPTYRLNVWNLVVKESKQTRLGEIRNGTIRWKCQLSHRYKDHPAVRTSRKTSAVDAFLNFTSYDYVRVYPRSFGYEVRWIDVRYYYKNHFPFTAIAFIDPHHRILDSFVGWVTPQKLEEMTRSYSPKMPSSTN